VTFVGFRCPADPTTTGNDSYGPGNYATNQLLFKDRFQLNSKDIPDGTANTVLFAEKHAACSYWALTDGREVPWYTPDESSGFQVRPAQCDPALPQTPHRDGIQVGMADASVRLVRPSVSPATWYAAHTPGGGEQPGADW
jgi:hypothetical protein